MGTMNLEEAAQFLHMSPSALRQKAKQGVVPGCKPGKRWVFLKSDLVAFLRAGQTRVRHASNLESRIDACHSIDEEALGGFGSRLPMESEYASRLGLAIEKPHRKCTTDSEPNTGELFS
jgi:hypothetical protein